MQDDLLPGWGLRPIELSDRAVFNTHLRTLHRPLSDYTFSQVFTWRNSLRLLWRLIDDHLCVFANGAGDLTLLLPPIASAPDSRIPALVIDRTFELMDDYNAQHHVPDRSRMEYVSEELLATLGESSLQPQPMGHDYVYDTQRMIDLAGGDLKSKRQERGRFIRDNQFVVATYDPAAHLNDCVRLLNSWKSHQDASHTNEASVNAIKRQSETFATELSLRHADELGLRGMVVHVAGRVSGFTFGESLGRDQASVVIEKTDLSIKGLAQFIFSEFCRTCWSDRPRINAGDDWGLESLAWTKASYRPIEKMNKFVVKKLPSAQVTSGWENRERISVRLGKESDIEAAEQLESVCFDTYRLNRKQLRAFQRSDRAVFMVAEMSGRLIGEGVSLIRHHRSGISARLYTLAVHDEARGRGVGNQLLEAMIGQCVSRGAKRIHLQVERTNQSAIRLYRRHDFEEVEPLPGYYGNGRDGIHFVCDLSRRLAADRSAYKPAA